MPPASALQAWGDGLPKLLAYIAYNFYQTIPLLAIAGQQLWQITEYTVMIFLVTGGIFITGLLLMGAGQCASGNSHSRHSRAGGDPPGWRTS